MMKKLDINHVLARNLKYAMEAKYGAVNQSELSRISTVPQTTIGVLLDPARRLPTKSGKIPSATLTQINKLALALDMEPWELLHPDLEQAQKAKEMYEKIEKSFKSLPPETKAKAPI